jgi:hypothetical protein
MAPASGAVALNHDARDSQEFCTSNDEHLHPAAQRHDRQVDTVVDWRFAMRPTRYLPFVGLVLVATAVAAAAQPPVTTPYEPPTRCSSLNVFGGVSTAESSAGGLVGGAAGWQITPWFGLEADAAWLDRPGSETGFSAAIHTRWSLVTGWRATPFVKAGGGLYHASLDVDDDTVPAFYRDRLDGDAAPVEDVGLRHSFTDPAVIAGGGVDILLSRRVSLRPQADAMFVFDHGKTRVMPAFTLHLAFHFEEHPITPSRR